MQEFTPQRPHILKDNVRPFAVRAKLSAAEILDGMKEISFQARNLGIAFEIWQNALKERATIFLGLAGAMIPAGLRDVIVTMIKHRLIDCVVSTGANLFHDLHEILGFCHYKGSDSANDTWLRESKVDRIYDVYGSEDEFTESDRVIANFALTLENRPYTTREFFHLFGRYLTPVAKSEGIITVAARAGVPIYCPAIGDSSYGIALGCGMVKGLPQVIFDTVEDVKETARIVIASGCTGVIFIGGGTPKNFTQQTEVTANMMGFKVEGHRYCIQITTDAPHWGGLSGCTFRESQSWGKIHHRAEMISVYCDATIALPLLVAGLVERQAGSFRKRLPIFAQDRRLVISFEEIGSPEERVPVHA
jgi:deoxyhypusine synthase